MSDLSTDVSIKYTWCVVVLITVILTLDTLTYTYTGYEAMDHHGVCGWRLCSGPGMYCTVL